MPFHQDSFLWSPLPASTLLLVWLGELVGSVKGPAHSSSAQVGGLGWGFLEGFPTELMETHQEGFPTELMETHHEGFPTELMETRHFTHLTLPLFLALSLCLLHTHSHHLPLVSFSSFQLLILSHVSPSPWDFVTNFFRGPPLPSWGFSWKKKKNKRERLHQK